MRSDPLEYIDRPKKVHEGGGTWSGLVLVAELIAAGVPSLLRSIGRQAVRMNHLRVYELVQRGAG